MNTREALIKILTSLQGKDLTPYPADLQEAILLEFDALGLPPGVGRHNVLLMSLDLWSRWAWPRTVMEEELSLEQKKYLIIFMLRTMNQSWYITLCDLKGYYHKY